MPPCARPLPKPTPSASWRPTPSATLVAPCPQASVWKFTEPRATIWPAIWTAARWKCSEAPGTVVVHGRVGDAAGYAMRGGELIVRDGCGWRGGINMKQYGGKCPVIVVGGDAGNFLGEYMAGGIIVLMGRAGDHLASGMHGGVIYLRRNNTPAVVPDGLDLRELTDEDTATLGALLARYDACFGTEPHEHASVDEFVALRPASSRPYATMYAS